MFLYTIYDKSAEEAGPVFNAVNDSVAIRQVVQMMTDIPPHIRGDYKLYCLGSWDNKSMIIEKSVPWEIDFTLHLDKAMKYTVIERSADE